MSANLNYTKALLNPSTLNSILFRSFPVSVNLTISTNIVPLIGLNISKSSQQSYPPVLNSFSSSLDYQQAKLSADKKYLLVPFLMQWNNSTPLSFNGNISAELTGIPNQPPGDYGNGAGPLSVTAGVNQNTVIVSFPVNGPIASEFTKNGSLPHGTYTFQLSVLAFGTTIPFEESVTL